MILKFQQRFNTSYDVGLITDYLLVVRITLAWP